MGYGVIGALQLLVDWSLFVLLTAIGMPVAGGNLAARVGGACLGFWLNGRYTFAGPEGSRANGRALWRFALVWLTLTVLSTVAVVAVARWLGLHGAWLAKPLVDAALAVAGFAAARWWIYR